MALNQVVPGLYHLSLGIVNAYLLISPKPGGGEEVTLIDTGTPGSEKKILAAMRALGKAPQDLHHIILTHVHSDHAGSARPWSRPRVRTSPCTRWMPSSLLRARRCGSPFGLDRGGSTG